MITFTCELGLGDDVRRSITEVAKVVRELAKEFMMISCYKIKPEE